MRYIIASLVLLCGLHVRAEDPARPVSRLPDGAVPVHPEAFSGDALWRAVAKVDPPEEWHKVITPENRENFPGDFTLNAFTNGASATFWFTYCQTNFETMLHHVELFEPDPSILDSPRADKGLVSVRVQTHSDKKKGSVAYHAEFTYPTNRLCRTYLRVTTTRGRLWPISLAAFLKQPDPMVVEDDDINIKIEL